MSRTSSISSKELAYLIDRGKSLNEDLEKQLNTVKELVSKLTDIVTNNFLEKTSDTIIPKSLLIIISDKKEKEDTRIKFNPERRTELILDFLKLKQVGALSEKEIAIWLCSGFQGFIMPSKDISIRLKKIGFETLRFFIRSIYLKYDRENRNKMKLYRDLIKRTQFSKNDGLHILKHFSDPQPGKYPQELDLED